MDSDRRGLTPHRREHWGVDGAEEPEAAFDVMRTPEETRFEAKRLLWRDSAIILAGIVVALLIAQLLPHADPGLAADATDLASGAGPGASLARGSSLAPATTFGPIVDPSLAIDATRPPRPAVTLPPTGSFEPGATDGPTPRPTKKPPATSPPATPEPTPEVTPEITPIPPPTVSMSCSVAALTVTCDATTSDIVAGSQRWTMGGDGVLVAGGDGSNSVEWTYVEAGAHTVTLTVDGDDGSQVSDSEEVST